MGASGGMFFLVLHAALKLAPATGTDDSVARKLVNAIARADRSYKWYRCVGGHLHTLQRFGAIC